MTTPLLRQLAHKAMSQTASPWLRHQAGARHHFEDGVAFNYQDPPGPSFSYVAVLGKSCPLDDVKKRADAYFAGKPGGYGILVEGDAGCPLEAELKRRGWTVFEDEPALVIARLSADEIEKAQKVPPELSIRLVQDESLLNDFNATITTVFAPPPEMASFVIFRLDQLNNPDVALFIGYVEGRPVSTALVLCTAGIAVITGVTTLEAFRGRGYGAALTRAALIEGARRGSYAAALRSGPLSVPLYKRLGFQYACQHRTYVEPLEN